MSDLLRKGAGSPLGRSGFISPEHLEKCRDTRTTTYPDGTTVVEGTMNTEALKIIVTGTVILGMGTLLVMKFG